MTRHFAYIEWTECAAFPLMIIAATMIADICSFPSCFLIFPSGERNTRTVSLTWFVILPFLFDCFESCCIYFFASFPLSFELCFIGSIVTSSLFFLSPEGFLQCWHQHYTLLVYIPCILCCSLCVLPSDRSHSILKASRSRKHLVFWTSSWHCIVHCLINLHVKGMMQR